MSEHPELREAPPTLAREIAGTLWGHHEAAASVSHRPDDVRLLFCDANASMLLADALLAGPVGKLQAELDNALDARQRISDSYDEMQALYDQVSDGPVGVLQAELEHVRLKLADPERIRREAIGAWVLGHLRWHEFRPWHPGAWVPEPYPGTCGGCGLLERLHPWAVICGEPRSAGYDHGLNTVLAAGESAVTGEPT